MPSRRGVMAGLLATGLAPRSGWAQAGSPAYLAAARTGQGAFVLCGLSPDGHILFQRPLPARGHAAAAHPLQPQAVAFARRPGDFALVIDCVTGQVLHRITAPAGRHFYGHGVFAPAGPEGSGSSAAGGLLFTTENDYEAGQGVIGVWDAGRAYARVGEFASGGVGPHDIRLMPDGQTLVVANGGIETHPDTGRAKLNLPSMRPNLTYLSLDGQVQEVMQLAPAHRLNSIRHLAVAPDGTVGFAMQWQGDPFQAPPLLGLHRRNAAARLVPSDERLHRGLQGYLGSIALSQDGSQVAVTAPRGGQALVYDTGSLRLIRQVAEPDVCGVAPGAAGFVLTTGTGRVLDAAGAVHPGPAGLQWDNHLVAL